MGIKYHMRKKIMIFHYECTLGDGYQHWGTAEVKSGEYGNVIAIGENFPYIMLYTH